MIYVNRRKQVKHLPSSSLRRSHKCTPLREHGFDELAAFSVKCTTSRTACKRSTTTVPQCCARAEHGQTFGTYLKNEVPPDRSIRKMKLTRRKTASCNARTQKIVHERSTSALHFEFPGRPLRSLVEIPVRPR